VTFRLGIATWGERAPHPDTGELPSPREGFLQLTELARTADRVGLDIVAVGEGHGAEHVNPDPLQLRAAGHGIGVMLNVMEGRWDQLVPYVKAYREALRGFRHSTRGAVGLLLPGLVVSDDDAARSPDALTLAYPHFAASTRTFGAASADEPAWTPEEFREQYGPEGALLVGGVSDVVTKLRAMRETLELDRVLVRVDVNGLPHDAALRTVELLGREVLPALR